MKCGEERAGSPLQERMWSKPSWEHRQVARAPGGSPTAARGGSRRSGFRPRVRGSRGRRNGSVRPTRPSSRRAGRARCPWTSLSGRSPTRTDSTRTSPGTTRPRCRACRRGPMCSGGSCRPVPSLRRCRTPGRDPPSCRCCTSSGPPRTCSGSWWLSSGPCRWSRGRTGRRTPGWISCGCGDLRSRHRRRRTG